VVKGMPAKGRSLPLTLKPTTIPKSQNTPLRRGCGVRPLFTGQNSQPSRRCEEGRHRAPHGAAAGNRVSANAEGRRGHFPEGRFSPES